MITSGRPLMRQAEPVRIIGHESDKPMRQDDDQAAAKRREKCGAAIDRARKDGREDNDQDGIESGLARERTFMSDPDHDQRGEKDNNPAQRDLDEVKSFGSRPNREAVRQNYKMHSFQKFYRRKKSMPSVLRPTLLCDKSDRAREMRFRNWKREMVPSGTNEWRIIMAQGSKKKYTGKQKRKAEHIEEGYEKRGVKKKRSGAPRLGDREQVR